MQISLQHRIEYISANQWNAQHASTRQQREAATHHMGQMTRQPPQRQETYP